MKTKPRDRKKNYSRMKSEDFQAILGLLFEEKRPLAQFKVLGITRRLPPNE